MIAAVVSDLIFATKITSTAGTVGADVQIVRSLDQLSAWLEGGGGAMALVDLEADAVDPMAAVRACHLHRVHVVAFGSHVRADLMEAARKAGADRVVARSAFVRELPALLAGFPLP